MFLGRVVHFALGKKGFFAARPQTLPPRSCSLCKLLFFVAWIRVSYYYSYSRVFIFFHLSEEARIVGGADFNKKSKYFGILFWWIACASKKLLNIFVL